MKKDIWVMGISGVGNRFHDNSVCLTKNGEVVFAASEERYTRLKHDASFPGNAIEASLAFAGIKKSDISLYATGWPRFSPLKALLGVDKVGIVRSGIDYLKNSKLKGLIFLARHAKDLSVKTVYPSLQKGKTLFFDHYLAHASSAYRTSGLKKCLAVIWDGFGTKKDGTLAAGGVFICQDGKITEVETHPIEASLGLFYEGVTNMLGFTPAEGEGKTMGLAAYGNPKRFYGKLRKFAPTFKDGKWLKNPHWLDTLVSVDFKYKDIFSQTETARAYLKMIGKSREDFAAACQEILEEEAIAFFKYLYKKYKFSKFVTSGGVFLNVKMGKRIRELPFVESFFVHPHAGDGGLALGAALEAFQEEFSERPVLFKMESAALGDEFSEKEILKDLRETEGIVFSKPKDICKYAAKKIAGGTVLGWFQGRAEWGPRALGQRSVLGDPRKLKIKERINKYLKKREWFMPFAPSILAEKADKLLIDIAECPFMTMAYDVTTFGKKAIAAAVHVDKTSRPQTVDKRLNPLYWKVIAEFEKLTGVPAILNTSFNRHGLPIVNSPYDAIEHLLWGAIDELIIGGFAVRLKKS